MHCNLNLYAPERGTPEHFLFHINKYPDGQQSIDLHPTGQQLKKTKTVLIQSRFNSWKDLELIVDAKRVVDYMFRDSKHNVKVSLHIPYLLGARCDRRFNNTSSSYLKETLAPIINSLNFHKVTVLDSHSTVSEAVIDRCFNVPLYDVLDLKGVLSNIHFTTILIPDTGAYKRVMDLIENVDFEGKDTVRVYQAYKARINNTIETKLPGVSFKDEDVLIIDDICSRGGTFMNLAQLLKKAGASTVKLMVTHYEGTADEEALQASGIDSVISTNSIGEVTSVFENNFVTKYDVFQ